MSIPRSVAEILRQHVTFEREGIDRMYLNVFVPRLQREAGVAGFFRFHRGHRFVSSVLMDPISKAFVQQLEEFARHHGMAVVPFRKGERKHKVAARYLKRFKADEGVLFIGKAQEKVPVFRTERRRNAKTGITYAWLVRSTAMVNQFYVYAVDRDLGPFFLKFCSYFPYNAKLCVNGHEWLKRQLDRREIGYEALDNGILSCAHPKRAQALADAFSGQKIDALLRKWLRRLPHPFTRADRAAGYRYDISILQAEFSLTQVLDRPVTGRGRSGGRCAPALHSARSYTADSCPRLPSSLPAYTALDNAAICGHKGKVRTRLYTRGLLEGPGLLARMSPGPSSIRRSHLKEWRNAAALSWANSDLREPPNKAAKSVGGNAEESLHATPGFDGVAR